MDDPKSAGHTNSCRENTACVWLRRPVSAKSLQQQFAKKAMSGLAIKVRVYIGRFIPLLLLLFEWPKESSPSRCVQCWGAAEVRADGEQTQRTAGLSAACLRRARNRSACHHRANVLIWEKTTPPRFPPAALLTLVGSTASAHQVLFEGRHFIRCIPVWRCADPPHEVQFWQRTKSSIRWIFGVVQYRPPGRWIDSHQCCALYALDSVRC